MMTLAMEEDSAERPESRRRQREEERERRRMRDRLRRQSMTLEQRERHLAKRRRNYQLRRLRAEPSRLNSSATISRESGGEIVISKHHDQAVNSAPEVITSRDDHGFEKLNSECLQSVGSETLAQKTVNVTRRLRLSQLRCFARSLHQCGGGNHEREAAVLVSKRDADMTLQYGDNYSSRLPSGLRLNRIKRLARGFSALNTEMDGQSHQVEQNIVVSSGERALEGEVKNAL